MKISNIIVTSKHQQCDLAWKGHKLWHQTRTQNRANSVNNANQYTNNANYVFTIARRHVLQK